MWRRCVVVLSSGLIAAPAAATVLTITDGGTVIVTGHPALSSVSAVEAAPLPPPPALAAPLARASAAAGLAETLIAAVAWVESRYRTDARSPAGAIGVMQLMPATARDLGVDPHDERANLVGGAAYLRRLLDRFDGDLVKALAAYNAGPGAVERHHGVPPYPETRRYVADVLARLAASAAE